MAFYAQLGWAIAALVTLGALFIAWRVALANRREESASLHRCESALASMEFLLVFVPLLTIVLAVWQLALMLNAQLNVAYSAYAAARGASVIAYMDLPNEPEGELLKDGEKWAKINRAALPGVIAISPGSFSSASGAYASAQIDRAQDASFNPALPGTDEALNMLGHATVLTLHRGDAVLSSSSRRNRAAVKSLYASLATDVRINGNNRDVAMNLSSADTLDVTVEYDFWLNIPYAGRMMKAAFDNNNFQFSSAYGYPTLKLTETVVVRAWPKKKAF